jgi:hypothetical protein
VVTLPSERDFNQEWKLTTDCSYNDATQKIEVGVILDNGFAESNNTRILEIGLPSDSVKVESQVADFVRTSMSDLIVEYMKIRAEGDKR